MQEAGTPTEVEGQDAAVERLQDRRESHARGRLAGDAAVLVGLAGVAITQPVLDLFGKNPTFFVAGNYGRRQIVMFALVVALVPAAVVFVLTAPARLAGRPAGTVAHALGVGLLSGLFGLVLCQTLGVEALAPALGLALLLGTGVALAEMRQGAVRRFLVYLAAGNLVFVALFAFASPTSELLSGGFYADEGSVSGPGLKGPVVVVVLDEFPLTSILRPDGTINEVRYPNLAAIAARSTWFRNASAEGSETMRSVPSILTGNAADDDDLPIYQDHPRNLFTLFGGRYPVHNYEVVTDLCPADTCGRPPGQPLRQALSDASVVYRHRIFPERLREGLPAIDQGWGNFGDGLGGATQAAPEQPVPTTPSGERDPLERMEELPATDDGRIGQVGALRRQLLTVGTDPSIHLVHVLLPHHPYELTPWGVTSSDTWLPREMPSPGDANYERAYDELYGLQAMQIAAVDQVLGEFVDHLEASGAWDDTTLALVSDHGVDITRPVFARRATPETQEEIFRIPLMIKAPGQTRGEVRDEPATTLDVLPSLIDILGIDTDWDTDGHSLFDGSEPGYERLLTTNLEDGLGFVARQQAFLRPGDGWASVVGIGEQGDLVGSDVADHARGEPSELAWSFDGAEALADPAGAGGVVPVLLGGEVSGSPDPPPELVVALDGVISGTIGGYLPSGDGAWSFTGLLGPEVEGGADQVVAYEVERGGGTITLHPLVT